MIEREMKAERDDEVTQKRERERIKDMAGSDKPREKMLANGVSSLKDRELLALMLNTGTAQMNVLELADKVLELAHNNLDELGRLAIEDFMSIKGVGIAKAAHIMATLEFGKRRVNFMPEGGKRYVKSGLDAFNLLRWRMCDFAEERFYAIYLDRSLGLIEYKELFKGGIDMALVDIRIVFERALQLRSTRFIVVHNHPSGNVEPSEPDKQITRKLAEAGKIMQILLIDHVIVTKVNYYSFMENGGL